ncbi:hypothetical protein [Desulfosporosinus youngiae]|uniref:Uncharacterized protein n=1 Tax=Desulfosporosinus youngiae DSM 17734 TaxID=768710 RepID=H5Y050_9FIRM|nr:hypothetical protein [Desulfosporosinus youngiae]EHQ91959.1 hypothetical protein DesyoDRAFT_5024 [Desulfosporosinus youngiae DSM 17734]
MRFVGDKPNHPYEPTGPQGFPGQLPNGHFGSGYSPGAIRNTLGSGLKASGVFQKDGQIQNLRGGFIGPKQPPPAGRQWQGPSPANQGMGYMQEQGYNQGTPYTQGMPYHQGQARQLILQPAQEGVSGNGVATISPDNSFLLIANLPPPQTFLGYGQPAVYAAYLVDDKGKTGFLVGSLRQVGNGVYRAHFQSPVPLHHYSRVVVSAESPAQLGHVPKGPLILKVKDSMGVMTFLRPMKTTATTIWGKITGFISSRRKPPISPEAVVPIHPEAEQISPELMQSLNQMGVNPEMPASAPPLPPTMPPDGTLNQ